MIKNEIRQGVVSRIGVSGEGIIKDGEYTVFVPFTLPTEKIEYKVLKVKDKLVFGKVLEVLTPCEERVRPNCDVYYKCGGCQLQHLKYKEQLKLKAKTVSDCLSKIGFITFDVPITQKSDNDYEYRNKLQLPVRDDGELKIGFFAPNSHRVVEINDCPIQPRWCSTLISVFRSFILSNKITAYNDESGTGLIRHIVCRDVEGHLLITVVVNGDELLYSDLLIEELKKKFTRFSLFLNVNKKDDNVILGDKFICLYGPNKVKLNDMGIIAEMGAESFMQVNDSVRRKIYQKAFELADLDENTVVIDGYSGAGMLTALFAQRCFKAIGVEIIKEAVDIANELKNNNGLKNMENILGDCAEVLPQILERERVSNKKTVLILDPPRQGVSEEVISAIKKSLPDKIIYISCSPQTLARDLGLILGTFKVVDGKTVKCENPESLYELSFVQPYDMFPQTKHVETVVGLYLKG